MWLVSFANVGLWLTCLFAWTCHGIENQRRSKQISTNGGSFEGWVSRTIDDKEVLVFEADERIYSAASKDAPTNPRGIPYAPFVDRVEDYVSSRADVEGALKSFQEMIS